MISRVRAFLTWVLFHATSLICAGALPVKTEPVTIDGTIQSFFWSSPMEFRVEGPHAWLLAGGGDPSTYYLVVKTDSLTPEAWWRSPSPTVRKLVIALFHLSYSEEDGPELPRFEVESDRFDAAESEQRKAEIADVLDNLDEIKARLSPWLETQ